MWIVARCALQLIVYQRNLRPNARRPVVDLGGGAGLPQLTVFESKRIRVAERNRMIIGKIRSQTPREPGALALTLRDHAPRSHACHRDVLCERISVGLRAVQHVDGADRDRAVMAGKAQFRRASRLPQPDRIHRARLIGNVGRAGQVPVPERAVGRGTCAVRRMAENANFVLCDGLDLSRSRHGEIVLCVRDVRNPVRRGWQRGQCQNRDIRQSPLHSSTARSVSSENTTMRPLNMSAT